MARYVQEFQVNVAPQTVHATINQYLQSEGYEYINYDGENVFKKGQGVWGNPTFFKLSYVGNMVRLETWMKYAFFPGVYVGELGITGFAGSAVKGPWKKRIANIENILSNMAVQKTYYPPTSVSNTGNCFDDNTTQLLNKNDGFEETRNINENRTNPAIKNAPVFCNECGSQMPEGTIFCSVCGQKRFDANAQNATLPGTSPYQQFEPQTSSYNFNETNTPSDSYPVSRKEFISKYAQPSLRKNITSIAILCYICAGLTFIVSCLFNPIGIIDALILAGLALGMHLAKSKVCAILILILSIIEVLLSLVSGSFPFWWLIAGVSAVITFSKIEKQYKGFIANGNRN